MSTRNHAFLLCCLSSLLVTILVFTAAETKAENEVILADLTKEALETNPEIMAARANWQRTQAIIEARRALPDPQFSYTYFMENIETRVGPQRNIFGLKQSFPFHLLDDLVVQNGSFGTLLLGRR